MNTVNIFENATLVTDTENGFAYAENETCENLFQVCCDQNGKIDFDDCGWDWGICGDYNSEMHYKDGYNSVKAVFDQFRAKFE